MQLAPTEEQRLIQRTARLRRRVLSPRAAARDTSSEFPTAELRELGKLGLLAIAVPEELGGAGAGTVAYSLALQELARGDASVAVAVSVTNMVGELIAKHGTPAQQHAWNPRLASGELVAGAFGLSEPAAGSDPAAMRTVATRTATGWRLTGSKQWITSGDHAGVMIVWAMTDRAGLEPGNVGSAARRGWPRAETRRRSQGHHGVHRAGRRTRPVRRAARGQDGAARVQHRAARARRCRGRRRCRARRTRTRVRARDDRARRRRDRHARGAVGIARRAGGSRAVREGARDVRSTDHQASGDRGDARGCGDVARCGASHDAARGVLEGARRAVLAARRDGESCSRASTRGRSATSRCKSTAATATCGTFPSSARSAMPA